ncbi:MAG TPA: hypothetical protein VKG79_07355 [Bryobacteraceae bacterium]|nr:hypothetical protein [Bryobacteraceae bacterium]
MGRCNSCFAIVKKHDLECYVCGDKLPRRRRLAYKRKEISVASNILFLASLGFIFYSFFSKEELSLATSLAVSGGLLVLRIVADKVSRPSDSATR